MQPCLISSVSTKSRLNSEFDGTPYICELYIMFFDWSHVLCHLVNLLEE